MRLLRRVIRLARHRCPVRAVSRLLLLVLLVLSRVRIHAIRLLLLLLGGISTGRRLLLLLLRGVRSLLCVGCVGLLRVHGRLVLLLVGVLRVGGGCCCCCCVLGCQHRGALRLHLDGGVVGGGLLVLLVPEAVGVPVEDEGCEEEQPAAGTRVSRGGGADFELGEFEGARGWGGWTYHSRALTPATALISARPTSPATAARLEMVQ